MIRALTILFLCQLAGEAVVRALGVAFPGPVLGMALFVAGLFALGRSSADLDATVDGILRNLSLLFVPAAVGLIQQGGVIRENWVAILVAIVASTLLTLIVTVLTFRAVARLQARRRP